MAVLGLCCALVYLLKRNVRICNDTFQLETLFRVGLLFWLPFGALLMVCFMLSLLAIQKDRHAFFAWFIDLGFTTFLGSFVRIPYSLLYSFLFF